MKQFLISRSCYLLKLSNSVCSTNIIVQPLRHLEAKRGRLTKENFHTWSNSWIYYWILHNVQGVSLLVKFKLTKSHKLHIFRRATMRTFIDNLRYYAQYNWLCYFVYFLTVLCQKGRNEEEKKKEIYRHWKCSHSYPDTFQSLAKVLRLVSSTLWAQNVA